MLFLVGCTESMHLIFASHVSHWMPVHPTSQVHVSGAVQVPPFWHALLQKAERQKLMMWFKNKTPICTELTNALWHTLTPLSINLAGSAVWSLQCVAYITGVGHYRVVRCTWETALTICESTRITTVNGCSIKFIQSSMNKTATPHF